MSQVGQLAETVATAIAELEEGFAVQIEPSGDGGAIVTVPALDIGPRWQPSEIDLSFQIPFNYPFCAIYPYFTTVELVRTDGGDWPSALQRVEWRGAMRTQISLRANRWNPKVDTAAGAVLQVQRWFGTVT